VTYTIAAGNSALDACGYTPARTPNAFTVGASDETDLRARYSNYGSCIDLFAPGNAVDSTWASSDTAIANLSGTSMAAPMAAGAAAVYLGTNPGASPSTVMSALKNAGTQGALNTMDTSSPNLLLYSRVGFAPTAAAVTISGRVANNANLGVRGIELLLTDPSTGETRSVRTNYFGRYAFNDVPVGRTYVIVATSNKKYQILDATRTFTLNDDMTGLNFIADTYNF